MMYPQQTLIQFANSMIYLMLARFALNDLPHAAGLLNPCLPSEVSPITHANPEPAHEQRSIAAMEIEQAWREVTQALHEPEALMGMDEALQLGVKEGEIAAENLDKYKTLLAGYWLIAHDRAPDYIVDQTYRAAEVAWLEYWRWATRHGPEYTGGMDIEAKRAFDQASLEGTRLSKTVAIDALFHLVHEGGPAIEIGLDIPDAYGSYSAWLAELVAEK